MALFNEILIGRLNRWAQKFYGIKSGTASLTQLLPTVQTVNIIRSGTEDGYLQSHERFMFTVTQAAVAAQASAAQLTNPGNSGIVAVIEKVNILPGAAALCSVVIVGNSPNLANVITFAFNRIDGRSRPAPTCTLSTGTTVAPAANQAAFKMISSTTNNPEFIQNPNQELLLLPGFSLVTICELVNTQTNFSVMWRERALESSELA